MSQLLEFRHWFSTNFCVIPQWLTFQLIFDNWFFNGEVVDLSFLKLVVKLRRSF